MIYIGQPSESNFNYPDPADRHHNFCKLDKDGTSYCFSSKYGVGVENCHPKCLDISKPTGLNCGMTLSGLNCQRWNSNSPHYPKYKPIITMHNNCSSPDGDDKPWCYTTNPNVRWEYCQPECKVISTTSTTTMITTTTTTTTTTPTPKPIQINRTYNDSQNHQIHHHMVKPYRHNKCVVQNSNKLKSKMSTYSAKGFCFDCKNSVDSLMSGSYMGGSTRSIVSTGWETSLPEKFGDRIYYADDTATSFDFPWFVRVGIGFS